MLLRALSECLFKHWQGLKHISRKPDAVFDAVKKYFLMSSLHFPWCIFEPFPCVLSLGSREVSPCLFTSSGRCIEQVLIPPATFWIELYRMLNFVHYFSSEKMPHIRFLQKIPNMCDIQFFVRRKHKSRAQFQFPLTVSEKADLGFHKINWPCAVLCIRVHFTL